MTVILITSTLKLMSSQLLVWERTRWLIRVNFLYACSCVHICLCVSATLRPVPQPPIQMTDWENQLACELMQKSSTDRAAGSQTQCCHGHTQTHIESGLGVQSGLIPPVNQAMEKPWLLPWPNFNEPNLRKQTMLTAGGSHAKRINFFPLISLEWEGNTF